MANKIDEIIPAKLFENPVPLHSHWDSFSRFLKAVVPSTTIGIISFSLAVLFAEHHWSQWIIYLMIFLGVAMLTVDIYAVFVYEDERTDKQWRRNVYSQQLTIINLAIQNLTIINKVQNLNVGTNNSHAQSPTMLYPQIDDDVNATYKIAIIMLKQALGAWKANNNKRPKIKPISFDAIVKLIEVGHVRWQEACTMLDDAKVIKGAATSTWVPLVTDEFTAIGMLDALLISRGYYSHNKDGEREWRIALPQTQQF